MKQAKTIAQLGEDQLIGAIRSSHQVKGLGDDTVVLPYSAREDMLWTTDMLIQGIHFHIQKNNLKKIGQKAVNRSVSDIAAMGGVPRWALWNFSAPKEMTRRDFSNLKQGVLAACRKSNLILVGGDTACSPVLHMSVTVVGMVGKGKAIKRSSAKASDQLYVTGKLGGSILGKHFSFQPRVSEGRWLAARGATSMIDLSDGLLTDLRRLLKESQCGARLYLDQIPVSPAAKQLAKKSKLRPLSHACCDGEDYELLLTVPTRKAKALEREWHRRFKTKLTLIGEIQKKKGICFFALKETVPTDTNM